MIKDKTNIRHEYDRQCCCEKCKMHEVSLKEKILKDKIDTKDCN